jgi:hypothetical protein
VKKGKKKPSARKVERVTKAGPKSMPRRKSVAKVVAEKLDAEEAVEPFIGPIEQKPVATERVYFVVKKVHRGRSEFSVAEHGRRIPSGFYEVLNSRTLHMSAAIKRKNDLQAKCGERGDQEEERPAGQVWAAVGPWLEASVSVIWVVQEVVDGAEAQPEASSVPEVRILQAVRKSEVTGSPIWSTQGEFKEVFQILYQLRAEREGLSSYCGRCGSSSEREGQGAHHSFCRVPMEEQKALLEASA